MRECSNAQFNNVHSCIPAFLHLRARYDPPSVKLSVHGLSGCWSVPRMSLPSSIFNVRKRSSGLANVMTSSRLARPVLRRERRRRRRRLAALDRLRVEVVHAHVPLERRGIDVARELDAHVASSARRRIRRCVGALKMTSGGGAAGTRIVGSGSGASVSVGAFARFERARLGLDPLQSPRLLHHAGHAQPAPRVDARVEPELEGPSSSGACW